MVLTGIKRNYFPQKLPGIGPRGSGPDPQSSVYDSMASRVDPAADYKMNARDLNNRDDILSSNPDRARENGRLGHIHDRRRRPNLVPRRRHGGLAEGKRRRRAGGRFSTRSR
jgi:hypothetical protein